MDDSTSDPIEEWNWSNNPDDYERLEKIGLKNKVWRAKCTGDPENRIVILRTISFDPSVANSSLMNGVENLCDVDHPYIVRVLHTFLVDNTLWIVQESTGCEEGYLESVLEEVGEGLEEHLIRAILKQVLEVLQYLHEHEKVWYDVRCLHILFRLDGSVACSLLSLRSIVKLKTRDSLPFFAPELLQPKGGNEGDDLNFVGAKADIWAFGMTALQLALGHSPYARMQRPQITEHILTKSPPTERANVSQEFLSMLEMCFCTDVKQRATPSQLLQHPIFSNVPGSDYIHSNLIVKYRAKETDFTDGKPANEEQLQQPPPTEAKTQPTKSTSRPGSPPRTQVVTQQENVNEGNSVETSRPVTQTVATNTPGSPPSQSPVPSTAATQPQKPPQSKSAPKNAHSSNTSHNNHHDDVSRSSRHRDASKGRAQTKNVPIETYLGETANEFIVFIRAIPATNVRLVLESRSLQIVGTLPPLETPEGIQLVEPVNNQFERRVQFPSYVNSNHYEKGYNKSSSTLVLRFKKFVPIEIGSETF
jgi:serine/threonine-protein kinase OSR1/STK39